MMSQGEVVHVCITRTEACGHFRLLVQTRSFVPYETSRSLRPNLTFIPTYSSFRLLHVLAVLDSASMKKDNVEVS